MTGQRTIRRWSVRHAALLESVYAGFEAALRRLSPLLGRGGRRRAERPVAAVERRLKGIFFGCRMCGDCILSSTGMSCPMNCPKGMRNGPCGGVRADGSCEVAPAMPCVWVQAWEGSLRMRAGERMKAVQKPLDHRLWGASSWLRVAGEGPR